MVQAQKNIAQQMAQIAKDVGETIKDEVNEVGKTAVSQVTGVEKISTGGGKPSDQSKKAQGQNSQQVATQIEMEKRAKQNQEELAFYRRQLQEMRQEMHQIRQEKVEKQQAEAQEDQIKQAQLQRQGPSGPIMAPGGASKRGTALIGGKGKSKKTSFEVGGAGAKHSK